jgi:hypothetical protein
MFQFYLTNHLSDKLWANFLLAARCNATLRGALIHQTVAYVRDELGPHLALWPRCTPRDDAASRVVPQARRRADDTRWRMHGAAVRAQGWHRSRAALALSHVNQLRCRVELTHSEDWVGSHWMRAVLRRDPLLAAGIHKASQSPHLQSGGVGGGGVVERWWRA